MLALAGLALAIALLVPGLFLPVISIRGVLQPGGHRGSGAETARPGHLRPVHCGVEAADQSDVLPLLEASPGGLRARSSTARRATGGELKKGQDIEVYQQTRSILGSVRHLYRVGSVTAATLILLFSVLRAVRESRRW